MGKLLFMDLDDCIIESSPLIQEAVDRNTEFKNDKLLTLEQTLASCKFVHDYNTGEIARAYVKKEKPTLVGTVKLGSNDIVKVTSDDSEVNRLEVEKRRIYRWYKQPLEASRMALEKASWDREMFLESRDNFLETDNTKPFGEGVINYGTIYQERHLVPGVVDTLNNIVLSNEYDGVYVLSHHNGGREEVVKKSLIERLFKDVPFLGLRFHLEPHKPNSRRGRSSKAKFIMEKFGLTSLENCILIDDSIANLDEWDKHGGVAILYRPKTEEEEYQGYQEPHERDYPRITKMSEDEINFALTLCGNKYMKKIGF